MTCLNVVIIYSGLLEKQLIIIAVHIRGVYYFYTLNTIVVILFTTFCLYKNFQNGTKTAFSLSDAK